MLDTGDGSTGARGFSSFLVMVRQWNLSALFTAQVVPLFSATALVFGSAYWLGPSERGSFALATSTANLFGTLTSLGIFVAAANAYHAQLPGTAVYILKRYAVLIGAVCIVSTVILSLANGGEITTSTVRQGLYVILLSGIVSVHLVTTRTLQGVGTARAFRDIAIIQAVVTTVPGLVVASVTGQFGPVLLVWALGLMIATLLAALKLKATLSGPASRAGATRYVHEAISSHVGAMGQQVAFRLDVPLLGLFVSRYDLGVYSIASPIINFIFVLAETVALSIFGTRGRSMSIEVRRQHERRLLLMYGVSAVVAGLLLMACTWILISYFLPQYRDATPLVGIMIPGAVIQGVARIGLQRIAISERPRDGALFGLLSAGLALIYVPAILRAGVTGAAVASSLIYALQGVVMIFLLRRRGLI